jgi:hypothetical protein
MKTKLKMRDFGHGGIQSVFGDDKVIGRETGTPGVENRAIGRNNRCTDSGKESKPRVTRHRLLFLNLRWTQKQLNSICSFSPVAVVGQGWIPLIRLLSIGC